MALQNTYKVGEYLVEPGNIFKIYKIESQLSESGESEKTILFRPHFKEINDTEMICSCPINNIIPTDLRKVVTKEKFNFHLKELAKKRKATQTSELDALKLKFNQNVLEQTAEVFAILVSEKNTLETFPKNKKDFLVTITDSLAMEYAIIFAVNLATAREKIAKLQT